MKRTRLGLTVKLRVEVKGHRSPVRFCMERESMRGRLKITVQYWLLRSHNLQSGVHAA
ncbi:hypothetical protein CY34DRAFT_802104 [Suillus luteus UH-Slu-Lm8-n1]|uniref:Uncharacterized protein n=1 Tax=Suillus luteus UH-Slu-Lm8-n1 TaxID=930992 RepID=A0A0D0B580_9AGAM|nr:hypothetical protein CY34DRAFT_802104 [Suillus luteus UH-Slu-Lm8-n1]